MRTYQAAAVVMVCVGFVAWATGESRAEEAAGSVECAVFTLPTNDWFKAGWRHPNAMGTWADGLATVRLPDGYVPVSAPHANATQGYVVACRQ